MTVTWQEIATGICVALAAAVVLRNLLRVLNPSAGSGCQTGCSACPSSAKGHSPDFVPLQNLVDAGRQSRES
ncbi:MAG: hypothetical protein U0941_23180 [Planctomycetaceae bacterium]